MEEFAASQRKACELASIARSTFRYPANTEKDDGLRQRLTQLAHEKSPAMDTDDSPFCCAGKDRL